MNTTKKIIQALPHGVVPSDAKNVVEHQPTRIPNDTTYCDRYIQRIGKYGYKAVSEPDLMVFSDSDHEGLSKIVNFANESTERQL